MTSGTPASRIPRAWDGWVGFTPEGRGTLIDLGFPGLPAFILIVGILMLGAAVCPDPSGDLLATLVADGGLNGAAAASFLSVSK